MKQLPRLTEKQQRELERAERALRGCAALVKKNETIAAAFALGKAFGCFSTWMDPVGAISAAKRELALGRLERAAEEVQRAVDAISRQLNLPTDGRP
jgi:hypothetical protein